MSSDVNVLASEIGTLLAQMIISSSPSRTPSPLTRMLIFNVSTVPQSVTIVWAQP